MKRKIFARAGNTLCAVILTVCMAFSPVAAFADDTGGESTPTDEVTDVVSDNVSEAADAADDADSSDPKETETPLLTEADSEETAAEDESAEVYADEWDGTATDTSWYDDNTGADVFVLTTPQQLAGFAALVNGTDKVTFAGKTVKLGADIDMAGKPWTPIGNNVKSTDTTYKFCGTFDGQGHTVSGLYINDTSNFNRGFFGYISGAEIKDVTLNVDFTVSRLYVGGAAAKADSCTFENITVKGSIARLASSSNAVNSMGGIVGETVTSVVITDCVNEANINSEVTESDAKYSNSSYVGGIVGKAAKAEISGCENKGRIAGGYGVAGIVGDTATKASSVVRCVNRGEIVANRSGTTNSYAAGGIMGISAKDDSIENCVNYGNVTTNVRSTGGIVGSVSTAKTTVSNCYNAGKISSIYASGYAGGIAGTVGTSTYSKIEAYVTNCYSRGAVSGVDGTKVGGIIGNHNQSTINTDYIKSNYYLSGSAALGVGSATADTEGATDVFESADSYDALISGLGDAYKADIKSPINAGYPILRWQDPDAAYMATLQLQLDTDKNLGDDITVAVKSESGAVQTPAEGASAVNGYSYELGNGDYTYEITAKGYTDAAGNATASGSFSINSVSKTITVPLKAIQYTWTIDVTAADADLTLKDGSGNAVAPYSKENIAAEGAATKTQYVFKLYNGTYTYSASKFGYEEGTSTEAAEGSIIVNYADGSVTVPLVTTSSVARLTFNVSAADGKTDIVPSINITSKEGDYADSIIFAGSELKNLLFPTGKYSYTVSTSGYKKVSGEFELTDAYRNNPYTIDIELAASAAWDGESSDKEWYTKDPTADTFYIYTADELAGFAEIVNSGTDTFAGKTVKLMSNIDLGSGTWMPIGGYSYSSNKYFSGTFDGSGCSITINDGKFAANETGFGLFGYIKGTAASRAAVKNLTLYGNVNAESAAYTYFGGIAGYATYTDFSQIANAMSINVTVNTSSRGFIDLGGLVGWSVYNNFYSCANQGNINGVMNSTATRSMCYVGGIAGMATQATSANQYSIKSCYNNGNITSTGGTTTYAGGIVGNPSTNRYASMLNCYNSGIISSGQPLIGYGSYTGTGTGNNYFLDTTLGEGMTSLIGEAKTSDELKELAGTLGDDYKPGTLYPVLSWQAAPYSVALAKAPNKTDYNDFDDFDDTGMELTVYYTAKDAEAGTNGTTVVSGWQVVNGTCLASSQKSVTVSYMGSECEVPVNVTQIIHYINTDDLTFAIEAPVENQKPQTEIALTDAQKKKIASASITWYADGSEMSADAVFESGVYYRAVVTLESVYEDGAVWYNFARTAKPSVDGTYEILYRTLSDNARTLSFTATWKVSSTLTDKASHLYYAGDSRVAANYGQYLYDTLTVKSGATDVEYTLEALEKEALSIGIEETYSYQGLNSRENYLMTGIPVYELLKLACPDIVNASDESVITVGDKDFTLGKLRSTGASYDDNGEVIADSLPYLIAYGVNGVPYTAEKGPLYLAAPAANNAADNTADFVKNVSEIIINLVTAKQYQVTFEAVDLDGNTIENATVTVRDSYGNTVYEGELKTVNLNTGETYTYEITADGYGVKTGTVTGAATVKAELNKVWTGEYIEPAQDENGTYLIYNAEELMWYNHEAATVSNARSMEMMAANIKLMADIDLSGTEGKWLPLGSLNANTSIYFYVMDPDIPRYYGGGAYSGTFDGNGHIIRNLNLDWENFYELQLAWDGSVLAYSYRLDYIGGLFGMTRGATIKDLGIEGSISVLDRPVSMYADWYQLGGIVGFAEQGTQVTGCYADVDIRYTTDQSDDTLSGYPLSGYADKCDLYMGGIVGSLALSSSGKSGLIENCYSSGSIYGTGTRTVRAGGIVGATRNSINKISKCWSDMTITVSPSKTGETETFPTYAGGIIGDVNSVPMSTNDTEVSYCFALNPSITIELDAEYAHANRVIGNEDLEGNYCTPKYNFGLNGMQINGASVTLPEDEQSYRTAAGRSIAAERALTEKAYTNVYWNADEEIWQFTGEDYPIFVWQKKEVTKDDDNDPSDPSDPSGGGGSGGHHSGGGSSSGGSSSGTSGNTGTGTGTDTDTSKSEACTGGSECPSRPYSDVDTSQWYHASLDNVITKGIFEGISKDKFAPGSSMTRGMFATVIMRLEQQSGGATDGHTNKFTDVASGSWYEKGIAWAADAGVVKGISASEFAPSANITREQLAAMMYRYAEYLKLDVSTKSDASVFTDSADISSYAKTAVAWAYENGVMTGKTGGRIDPKGNATRAEVAAVVTRFAKLTAAAAE